MTASARKAGRPAYRGARKAAKVAAMTLTPDLLTAAGEALFGPRWQTDLAAALAVSDRTMRRWAAGQAEIPDGVAGELAQLLRRRTAELQRVLKRLERAT
jgi:hypothetical protein